MTDADKELMAGEVEWDRLVAALQGPDFFGVNAHPLQAVAFAEMQAILALAEDTPATSLAGIRAKAAIIQGHETFFDGITVDMRPWRSLVADLLRAVAAPVGA